MLLVSLLLFGGLICNFVNGQLPFNDASFPSVTAVVKIFDATDPSVAFCEAPQAYDASMHSPYQISSLPKMSSKSPESTDVINNYQYIGVSSVVEELVNGIIVAGVQKLTQDSSQQIADQTIANLGGDVKTAESSAQIHLNSIRDNLAENIQMSMDPGAKTRKKHHGHHNKPSFSRTTTSTCATSCEAASAPIDLTPTSNLQDLMTTNCVANLAECLVEDSVINGSTLNITGNFANIATCLCQSMTYGYRKGDTYQDACGILNVVEKAITCGNFGIDRCPSTGVPTLPPSGFDQCTAARKPTNSASTDPNVDYDLFLHPKSSVQSSNGVISANIPQNISDDEGLTYYYLYRASFINVKFTQISLCGYETVPEMVPGWKTVLLINNMHESDTEVDNSGRGSLPFAFISRRQCDMLITLRGTYSSYEWRMDFTISQVNGNMTSTDFDQVPQGKHHGGFAAFSNTVFPSFVALYEDLLASDQCGGADVKRRIIITGHSLGAGVGSVLGHMIGIKYGSVASVDAVLIAPPNALDSDATKEFNKAVNVRALKTDLDPIPALPCDTVDMPGGMPLCPDGHVLTGPYWETAKFTPVNGVVPVKVSDLQTMSNDPRWTANSIANLQLKLLPSMSVSGTVLDVAGFQFSGMHVCSYQCHLGQYCQDPTTQTWGCSDNTIKGLPNSVEPCNFIGKSIDIPI